MQMTKAPGKTNGIGSGNKNTNGNGNGTRRIHWTSLRIWASVLQALRQNAKPGIALWGLLALFFVSYRMTECVPAALDVVEGWKQRGGAFFAFAAQALFMAVVPAALRLLFLKRGRATRADALTLAMSILVFGLNGVATDRFFQLQAFLFGADSRPATLLKKTLLDMLAYTPLCNALILTAFAAFDNRFRRGTLRALFRSDLFRVRLPRVLTVSWCLWIPGLQVVYSLPVSLQMPVEAAIAGFWTLMFMVVRGKSRENG